MGVNIEYNEKIRKQASECLSKHKRERIAAEKKEPNFIKMFLSEDSVKNIGEH